MSEQKLDLILNKLDSHENMITQLVNMVAGLKVGQEELKAGQARHEKLLVKLTESQERQDRILEALAARSLDQEIEIKEIKIKSDKEAS
jgi:hypothetical protein